MSNKWTKDLVIAFSLSNLLYIGNWRKILFVQPDYFVEFGPRNIDFVGILLSVVILSAVLFASVGVVRRYFPDWIGLVHWAFLLALLVALNILRIQLPDFTDSFYIKSAVLLSAMSGVAIALILRRELVFRTAKGLVLVLSPFVLLTFSQSASGIFSNSVEIEKGTITSQLEDLEPERDSRVKTRVLWVVFDGFGYRVPFELAPVDLPEFKELQDESLIATNAESPAYWTVESIPALLTGKMVSKAEPINESDLLLRFPDGSSSPLSRLETIFSDVKALDGTNAVIGNYHPYCRLFRDQLAACEWEGRKLAGEKAIWDVVLSNFKTLAAHVSFFYRLFPEEQVESEFQEDEAIAQATAEAHFRRRNQINAVVADPRIDFAFIHLPIPHPPARFDKDTGNFGVKKQDYTDNLVLADLDLGEIRKALEEAGLWDETAVIVSTDHQWRVKKWKNEPVADEFSLTEADRETSGNIESKRIPFFLKMPHQESSLVFERPFNTVSTRELIKGIVAGEIGSVEEAAAWLRENSSSSKQLIAEE